MSHYTSQDIARLIEEEDVEFIRLQFVDAFGNLKNMAVAAKQLDMVLENRTIFDGAAIKGFDTADVDELVLVPDLDSFAIFPWRPQSGRVARFICDVRHPDGEPFMGDPRYILRNAAAEAEENGYIFNVGPESEFFLFDTAEDGSPTTATGEKGGFFDIGPVDAGENARRDIVMSLAEMGFEMESSYHSYEAAQHHIDFKYNDAMHTADNIMTYKLAVRTVARRHGLHATFMPKPNYGKKGSAMILNMFLCDKNGKNLFSDTSEEHGLSREAYYFMAGIMSHIKGLTLINNPIINSYKRLVPGYNAPVNISWSRTSRTPLMRITSTGKMGPRIVLRSPDGASNPYLVLAGCLKAGLEGIRKKMLPPVSLDEWNTDDVKFDILPRTLNEAVAEFEKDTFLHGIFGELLSEILVERKKDEWNRFCEQVTAWEVEKYLDRI